MAGRGTPEWALEEGRGEVRGLARKKRQVQGVQDHLVALHKKLDFAEKNEAARESAAYRDVAPELEKLRVTALHKCRDFLMTRSSPPSARCCQVPSVSAFISDPLPPSHKTQLLPRLGRKCDGCSFFLECTTAFTIWLLRGGLTRTLPNCLARCVETHLALGWCLECWPLWQLRTRN